MESERLYERLIGMWLCEPQVFVSNLTLERPVSILALGRILLLRAAFELGWEPVKLFEFR
jgi:hypothetical protein